MRKAILLPLLLAGTVLVAEDEAFQAKLNIDKSENAVLTESGMIYLPTHHEQAGNGILFEAEQMAGVDYNFPEARLRKDADGKAVVHAKFLEYRFRINIPGKYRAWYLASYPTNLGYQHGESMDGGETVTVIDSVQLAPNVKRWHSGPLYHLGKGEHSWTFPRPGAWCGGTALDKLMLLPEGISPKTAPDVRTTFRMPENGTIYLRRIKASLLKKWMLDFNSDLNEGRFFPEYQYDGKGPFRQVEKGKWEMVPKTVNYLFFRFRIENGKTQETLSPFIHNLKLMVVEK